MKIPLLNSINHSDRLYTMACGNGYSCYGFDVLDKKARAVLQWIGLNIRIVDGYEIKRIARELEIFPAMGTAEHYTKCMEILQRGQNFSSQTGKHCESELVPVLRGLEGKRVECDYFGERVRFWVGKSTGWMPAHLMIKTKRSHGGDAIFADKVSNVRVVTK